MSKAKPAQTAFEKACIRLDNFVSEYKETSLTFLNEDILSLQSQLEALQSQLKAKDERLEKFEAYFENKIREGYMSRRFAIDYIPAEKVDRWLAESNAKEVTE
jgi:peptidoglycan hydrolase CwlO-like protein